MSNPSFTLQNQKDHKSQFGLSRIAVKPHKQLSLKIQTL